MNNRELEKKIRESFADGAPDLLSRITASCEETVQSTEPPEREEHARVISPVMLRRTIAIAATFLVTLSVVLCFALIGRGGPDTPPPPLPTPPVAESFVYIDVNPSLLLSVDTDSNVVDFVCENEDARQLFDGVSLQGEELHSAVELVISKMIDGGYISDAESTILVSIESEDGMKSTAIKDTVEGSISASLSSVGVTCSVISQEITIDEELKNRAAEYGCSVGKMHYIDNLMDQFENLSDIDPLDLVNMPIKDLNDFFEDLTEGGNQNDPTIPGGSDVADDDKNKLLMIALLEIGIESPSEVNNVDVDFGFASGAHGLHFCYVVKFTVKATEEKYEVKVNVFTLRVEEVVGPLTNKKS